MSLSKELVTYLDGQLNAGLSAREIGRLVCRAVEEWAASAEEVAQYIYDRMREDATLHDGLRLALARSIIGDDEVVDAPSMPLEMDGHIRARLFGRVQNDPSVAQPPVDFASSQIEPEWSREGPFIAPISWRVDACHKAWERAADRPLDRGRARVQLIQWRAVERLAHLDPLALDELESMDLTPSVIEQLRMTAMQMRKITEGIGRLLEPAMLAG